MAAIWSEKMFTHSLEMVVSQLKTLTMNWSYKDVIVSNEHFIGNETIQAAYQLHIGNTT